MGVSGAVSVRRRRVHREPNKVPLGPIEKLDFLLGLSLSLSLSSLLLQPGRCPAPFRLLVSSPLYYFLFPFVSHLRPARSCSSSSRWRNSRSSLHCATHHCLLGQNWSVTRASGGGFGGDSFGWLGSPWAEGGSPIITANLGLNQRPGRGGRRGETNGRWGRTQWTRRSSSSSRWSGMRRRERERDGVGI